MQTSEVWYKATGHCKTSEYDLATLYLMEAGVGALEELESSNADRTDFCFYTDSAEKRNAIVSRFPEYSFSVEDEAARDWDRWWKDRATPVHVSRRLWVRPPWVSFTPQESDAILLELEAKSAFGTGDHATTALIAGMIERQNLAGKTFLDIGTGTGILSMLADKLGARLSIGTEIDRLALPCIAENFERNRTQNAHAVFGFLDVFNESARFDCIACNMIRTEFWPMRHDVERLLDSNGTFILTGQLTLEKNYVLDWFADCKFEVVSEETRDEWWCVEAKRKREP